MSRVRVLVMTVASIAAVALLRQASSCFGMAFIFGWLGVTVAFAEWLAIAVCLLTAAVLVIPLSSNGMDALERRASVRRRRS